MRGMVGEAGFPPIAARVPRFAGREPDVVRLPSDTASESVPPRHRAPPGGAVRAVRRGFGERPATARAFATSGPCLRAGRPRSQDAPLPGIRHQGLPGVLDAQVRTPAHGARGWRSPAIPGSCRIIDRALRGHARGRRGPCPGEGRGHARGRAETMPGDAPVTARARPRVAGGRPGRQPLAAADRRRVPAASAGSVRSSSGASCRPGDLPRHRPASC